MACAGAHTLPALLTIEALVRKGAAATQAPKTCSVCALLTTALVFPVAGPSVQASWIPGWTHTPSASHLLALGKSPESLIPLWCGVLQPLNPCIPTVCSLPSPKLQHFWMCL